jgi:hypothetical protein
MNPSEVTGQILPDLDHLWYGSREKLFNLNYLTIQIQWDGFDFNLSTEGEQSLDEFRPVFCRQ